MKTYSETRKAEIKEAIVEYIEKYPGTRKHYLGEACGEWYINLLPLVHELEEEGRIYSEYYRDPANMEFYDKYYTVKKNGNS